MIQNPGPWELIAGAVLAGGLASGLPTSGFSTLRTALGLSMIALLGWALYSMARQRFGDRTSDHVTESIISAVTLSLITWVVIVEPILHGANLPASSGLGAAVDITITFVLACLATRIAFSFDKRPFALTVLAASQGVAALGAITSFLGDFGGFPLISNAAVGFFALTAMTVGFAGSDPSMSQFEEPNGPSGARLGRLRLLNLALPVVLGPVLLTLVLTQMVVLSSFAVASFTIALSLLVVGHLISMVQSRASSTHWASHDKLTGLPNRALFRERAAQSLDRARRTQQKVGILYLDLDRFKHINDSLGHEAGDQLLEQVAKRILSSVDEADTVARLGGDEFAILVPALDDPEIPAKLARRLLKKFSAPFNLKPRPVFMSPSVGIAISENGVSLETLLTQADTAMYRAKESGRNNFAVWSQEMNEASKQRLLLETHLHSAISHNELRLVYQPKVSLQTGNVVGVEALIRWHHPTLGVISPGVFIHLAEESGLINQIGEWVLQTACEQARSWYDNGFTDLTVAVNLSSRQFQGQNVADLVSRILRNTNLPAHLLELELTESVAMSGDEATVTTLRDLQAMGVHCTIDDFGTGYSNLSYLSRFPIGSLKIDKAFVAQIDKSGDAAIVLAVIAMAHGLGLSVVAEGVETPEQAAFLAEHNCDQMQGFLFSKPIPPEELENLLMLEHVAAGPGRLGVRERSPLPRRIERSQPDSESGNHAHAKAEVVENTDDETATVNAFTEQWPN